MTSKHYFFSTLASVFIGFICLPVILVYITDPFQIYHQSFFPQIKFSSNQRFHNAGLIHSYLANPNENYDSIIIGTSMAENFRIDYIKRTLDWQNTLNLSMSGGHPIELQYTASYALASGKTKNVLWEINTGYMRQNKANQWNDNRDFPLYLYTPSIFDDVKYLFNHQNLQVAKNILLNKSFALTSQ